MESSDDDEDVASPRGPPPGGSFSSAPQNSVAVAESRLRKVIVRSVVGFFMVTSFVGIVWAGHLYLSALVVLIQVGLPVDSFGYFLCCVAGAAAYAAAAAAAAAAAVDMVTQAPLQVHRRRHAWHGCLMFCVHGKSGGDAFFIARHQSKQCSCLSMRASAFCIRARCRQLIAEFALVGLYNSNFPDAESVAV